MLVEKGLGVCLLLVVAVGEAGHLHGLRELPGGLDRVAVRVDARIVVVQGTEAVRLARAREEGARGPTRLESPVRFASRYPGAPLLEQPGRVAVGRALWDERV